MNQNQRFGKGSAGSDVHQESIQQLWSKSIFEYQDEMPNKYVRKDVK